jgi:hypothetical protein
MSHMPFHDLVFEEAQSVMRAFLREMDDRSPGLIRDVYITGSIALGDARPGRSDIDVVLIRPENIDNATTMAALEPVLADLRHLYPLPMLDGIVLNRRDLVAGPDAIYGHRPVISDGLPLLSESGSARNPVTWHTLRQCGISWRGIPIPELDLWHDTDRLRGWTATNLEEYWRPWLARSDRFFSRSGAWSLQPDFVEWGVLGVTRLHATLATGDILSKHRAGVWALEHFPSRWHGIVQEAMRIREGDITLPRFHPGSLRRRNDARAYIRMVLETTHELS